jgi:hypothetical protein
MMFLLGCAARPPVESAEFISKYKNACLPEAIVMAQSLRKSGIQSRVIRIGTDKWRHAICVYLYPPGDNILWGWDSKWKSNRLRAWVEDPHSIAKEWLRVTASYDTILSAQFLD